MEGLAVSLVVAREASRRGIPWKVVGGGSPEGSPDGCLDGSLDGSWNGTSGQAQGRSNWG